MLESLKIKYTHSGVLSSSIAMDKITSKEIFIKNKILTPKYLKFIFDSNILKKSKIINKIKSGEVDPRDGQFSNLSKAIEHVKVF